MYVAKPPRFSAIDDSWTVETQYLCTNGLICWFVICIVDNPSEQERVYIDGAILPAKERAEWIAKILNKCGQEYG